MDNLNHLRVLVAVSETGSFTRAAEQVNLTQPGISKHVSQLEEQYGLKLFDRLGKKVTLTQAGAILAEASREALATVASAEQRLQDLKGLRGGKLLLGASSPVGVHILPRILADFRDQYPAVEVSLEIAVTERIVARVLANKIELGLVSHEVQSPRLLAKAFMKDELVAISSNQHPWARRRRISPRDLVGETVVMAAKGAGTRATVEERLSEKGIALEKVIDFGNTEGVRNAVEAGLGVSIQARSVVQREAAAGLLAAIPLAGMDTTVRYFTVRRKDKHLSSATAAFLAFLEARAG